jgi:4-hydroxy-3-methylbut-2-enyl diphosphate reductase IspH
VEDESDLWNLDGWDRGLRTDITLGASTPEDLVGQIIRRLKPDQVRGRAGPAEDINFVLPKELRHG